MDYEFAGCDDVAADYDDRRRPPFEETLSPNLPRGLNLGRQIFYFERRYPAEFAAATRVPRPIRNIGHGA